MAQHVLAVAPGVLQCVRQDREPVEGPVVVNPLRQRDDGGRKRGPDGLKQDAMRRLYVATGLNKPKPPAEPATDTAGRVLWPKNNRPK